MIASGYNLGEHRRCGMDFSDLAFRTVGSGCSDRHGFLSDSICNH